MAERFVWVQDTIRSIWSCPKREVSSVWGSEVFHWGVWRRDPQEAHFCTEWILDLAHGPGSHLTAASPSGTLYRSVGTRGHWWLCWLLCGGSLCSH